MRREVTLVKFHVFFPFVFYGVKFVVFSVSLDLGNCILFSFHRVLRSFFCKHVSQLRGVFKL